MDLDLDQEADSWAHYRVRCKVRCAMVAGCMGLHGEGPLAHAVLQPVLSSLLVLIQDDVALYSR